MDSDAHPRRLVEPPPLIVPSPGRPVEDVVVLEPLQTAKPGRLRSVLRFVVAHPWFSMLSGLVFGLALAVICGLAASVAQVWLIVGLVTMGFARLVVWGWRRDQSAKAKAVALPPPAPAPPKGFFGQFAEGFGTTLIFCIGAMFVFSNKSSQDTPLPTPTRAVTAATPSMSGSKTQQYWQAAVAALHPHRFGSGADSKEGALPAWRHRLQQFRSALAHARAQTQTDVDHDLVTMAARHFDVDERYLQRQERIVKAATNLATSPQSLVALEQLSFEALTERIYRAQFDGQLPAETIEEFRAGKADQETYDQVFRDIEITQARLKERYNLEGRMFLLPAIPDTPSQSPDPHGAAPR